MIEIEVKGTDLRPGDLLVRAFGIRCVLKMRHRQKENELSVFALTLKTGKAPKTIRYCATPQKTYRVYRP